MTLNGVITLILRYFAEFSSFRGALPKVTCTMSSWKSSRSLYHLVMSFLLLLVVVTLAQLLYLRLLHYKSHSAAVGTCVTESLQSTSVSLVQSFCISHGYQIIIFYQLITVNTPHLLTLHSWLEIVSDIAIFVLKRDVKLQLTNSWLETHLFHKSFPSYIFLFHQDWLHGLRLGPDFLC